MGKFQAAHKKLKTASIIYASFTTILGYLRTGGCKPSFHSKFTSTLVKAVQQAWEEQERIGWDQILYGRISSKWGQAQSLFYASNPDTRRENFLQKTSGPTRPLRVYYLSLWGSGTIDVTACMGQQKKINRKF